ncbi:MAG: hypothetical protein AB1304_07720, partial [Bacteroidota bacterium]
NISVLSVFRFLFQSDFSTHSFVSAGLKTQAPFWKIYIKALITPHWHSVSNKEVFYFYFCV